MGSEGADVMKLQQFLNDTPDLRVAPAGSPGSAGMETMYYGPATAAAVSKMQVMFRAEVLTPGGLVDPTGYFGSMSRAKANDLCVADATTEEVDEAEEGAEEEEEDMDEEDDFELGGSASLDTMEIDSASNDDISEGKDDQEVAELTVEFADGDAELSRLDIKFTQSGADAWDAFETISLWIDGDKVAEENADDEDDYLSDEQTMRFSNLDIIGMEDEEMEIVIAVSTQNNLDTDELGTWNVSVESMRYFDADGVAVTEDSNFDFGISETFNIEVEGIDDEVIVKTSSNDPDATTLQVEDDSNSDWYNVFTFDLDTDDSVNDIEFNTVEVDVTVSSSTFDALVDDYELVIDGVTIDALSDNNGGTSGKYTDGTTVTLTFDVDGDVIVDAGDRVEAELMLRFNSLAAGDEGVTVQGLVTATNRNNIDAEGADDVTSLSGAATGDAHTLRTTGIDTDMSDSSAVVTVNDGANNDYVTFEIEVDVTAFEQDVYISTDDTVSVNWDLVNSAGTSLGAVATSSASSTVVLSSSADENVGYFEINEGETETITLTVTYSPGTAASISARLLLNSISFRDSAGAPNQTQTTLPKTDYRTAVKTIVN